MLRGYVCPVSFLTNEQLHELGFESVGHDVLVSDRASLYGADRISIGNNVRIDAFSILSAGEGGIHIGSNIHIAAHCGFFGQAPITLGDYSNVSGRSGIYSSTDDFSGEWLIGPCIADEFRAVTHSPVTLDRLTIVGTGSTLLPGTTMSEGSGLAAMSLARGHLEPYTMYAGTPARPIGKRSRRMAALAESLDGTRQS